MLDSLASVHPYIHCIIEPGADTVRNCQQNVGEGAFLARRYFRFACMQITSLIPRLYLRAHTQLLHVNCYMTLQTENVGRVLLLTYVCTFMCHVMSFMSRHITSRHVTSLHVMSHHVMRNMFTYLSMQTVDLC